MTNKVLKFSAFVLLGALLLGSCKDANNTGTPEEQTEKKANSELQGYMLAGIYTINGYGGIETVENNVGDTDETESYTTLLGFPYEKGQAGAKEMLASMWDINSKEDLTKRLGELLNDEKEKYKAWDYARLVNNVNTGYAAGYITKEEGKEWINKTLTKAKAAFKTWEDYHKNFMEGRKDWNPNDDSDSKAYEELSKNISNMSVYKNNPLN